MKITFLTFSINVQIQPNGYFALEINRLDDKNTIPIKKIERKNVHKYWFQQVNVGFNSQSLTPSIQEHSLFLSNNQMNENKIYQKFLRKSKQFERNFSVYASDSVRKITQKIGKKLVDEYGINLMDNKDEFILIIIFEKISYEIVIGKEIKFSKCFQVVNHRELYVSIKNELKLEILQNEGLEGVIPKGSLLFEENEKCEKKEKLESKKKSSKKEIIDPEKPTDENSKMITPDDYYLSFLKIPKNILYAAMLKITKLYDKFTKRIFNNVEENTERDFDEKENSKEMVKNSAPSMSVPDFVKEISKHRTGVDNIIKHVVKKAVKTEVIIDKTKDKIKITKPVVLETKKIVPLSLVNYKMFVCYAISILQVLNSSYQNMTRSEKNQFENGCSITTKLGRFFRGDKNVDQKVIFKLYERILPNYPIYQANDSGVRIF